MVLPPDGYNVAPGNCAKGKVIGARLPGTDTACQRSDEMAVSHAASGHRATEISTSGSVTGAMPLATGIWMMKTDSGVTKIGNTWPETHALEPGTDHMDPDTNAETFTEVLQPDAGIQRSRR